MSIHVSIDSSMECIIQAMPSVCPRKMLLPSNCVRNPLQSSDTPIRWPFSTLTKSGLTSWRQVEALNNDAMTIPYA